ncbi:uncharacterized protein LOC121520255 [Cheilinus undulatus]|uniref:uncharacterized protein LOC121520255 n=1 Tax=Cheilinus undulatus TaxID=241271 RepID=UPI001BD48FB1|nr:uncharacterized protein LOC121520255 [Cheilinus undulatus]
MDATDAAVVDPPVSCHPPTVEETRQAVNKLSEVFVTEFFTVGVWNYDSYYLIFGSGTRLFVSANPVVQPEVSIYPAASRSPLEEKRLLCVSSAMFPPLVRFSWRRRQKKSGRSENLPSSDERQLRESGCTASILAVDQRESDSYEYSCSVQHEGGEKVTTLAPTEFPTFLEPSTSLPTSPPTSSPPSPSPSLSPAPPSPSLPPSPSPSVSVYKLRLLLLLYTLLIVKSLVYCCGLFLMTVLRNKRLSTDCRQAG